MRVYVYGLLGRQAEIVKQEVGGSLDLRFMTRFSRVQADLFILLVDFCSHETDRMAFNFYGDRFHRHRGGIKKLVNFLKGIEQ